jgi:WD40 repeat protein
MIDLDKENLSIVMKLKHIQILTHDINAMSDYNKNFCFVKAIKGDMYIIWANKENYLEIYDLNKSSVLQKIKAHDDWINSVHHFYDPLENKDFIITCSDDKTIKIWDADFHMEVHNLKNILTIKQDTVATFRNAFVFTDFNNKCNYIVAELSDYIVAIYDQKGKFLWKIDKCYFLDIWEDCQLFETHLIVSYAGMVKFYNLKTGDLTKEFLSHGILAIAVVVNNLLVMADENGVIKTFDIIKHKLMNEQCISSSPILELIVWDIQFIIAGLANGKLEFYETKTLTKVRTIESGCEKVVYALPFIHPTYGPSLAISGPSGNEKSRLTLIYFCQNYDNELI